MTRTTKYILYTDGGARGNPGPAAAGVVIYDAKGKILKQFAVFLGKMTNNQAEYSALILGLGHLQKIIGDLRKISESTVEVFMDSELIVKQMNGEYKIKNKGLKPLSIKVEVLISQFGKAQFKHIPRGRNTLADKLLNRELDRHSA